MFDATIPDHFAISAALELLRARYENAPSYMPHPVREELRRAKAKLPPLSDALTANWLRDHAMTLDDIYDIEQLREAAFGEATGTKGLGECAVIHLSAKHGYRAGLDDRVAKRLAERRKIKQFDALEVVQAIWRYCAITRGEAWDLYRRLLNGTGRHGTALRSLEVMGQTKFEKFLKADDSSFA